MSYQDSFESEPGNCQSVIGRRSILSTVGASIFGGTLLTTASDSASGQQQEASITFNDQESDGRSIVIDRATTPVDGFILLRDSEMDILVSSPNRRPNLQAGETVVDVEVKLPEPLSETQEISATLMESNGGSLASDTARIWIDSENTSSQQ
jgi:hypothetical protein